jgi:hypothetical protein
VSEKYLPILARVLTCGLGNERFVFHFSSVTTMPQCARLVNLFSPRFTVTIIIMVVLCGLWALQLRPSSFVPPVKPADITSRSKSPREDKQPNSPHFHARVSEAEAKNNHPGPIQIAFLLLIHDKNGAKLAARSINRLFSPRHTFVVHIDKKADFDSLTTILLENFEQNSVTKALSTNILVMSSASVRWGSGTILRVELDVRVSFVSGIPKFP